MTGIEFTALPERPSAGWGDEWPEPQAPQGAALSWCSQKAIPYPSGAKVRNALELAPGIGVLRDCRFLKLHSFWGGSQFAERVFLIPSSEGL